MGWEEFIEFVFGLLITAAIALSAYGVFCLMTWHLWPGWVYLSLWALVVIGWAILARVKDTGKHSPRIDPEMERIERLEEANQ